VEVRTGRGWAGIRRKQGPGGDWPPLVIWNVLVGLNLVSSTHMEQGSPVCVLTLRCTAAPGFLLARLRAAAPALPAAATAAEPITAAFRKSRRLGPWVASAGVGTVGLSLN